MKITFITEAKFQGKIPIDHPNMRTDLAWQYHLDSYHHSLLNITSMDGTKYDLAIIIIPKTAPHLVYQHLQYIKSRCRYVTIMQEGPVDYWTDYTLQNQLQYLECMNSVDFLLCHNVCDISYFEGLFQKNTYVLQPVMVLENIIHWHTDMPTRDGTIIGGNMCKWYNGMVSLILAQQFELPVYAPTMGRKIPGEDMIDGLIHLPYMDWLNWMNQLKRFKFAVHLMPTVAAGTFSLNCAYWGVPCIGNELVDTQRNCHLLTSCNVNDISTAMKYINWLKEWDDKTYKEESDVIKSKYNEYYHPDVFKKSVELIFHKEL